MDKDRKQFFTKVKKRGFTLIELLVVISIIALLLSILMPSLQKAKEQARSVVCQSRLKQWHLAHSLYCEDNNGSYAVSWYWMQQLEPYYGGTATSILKLIQCPTCGDKTGKDGRKSPYGAWFRSIETLGRTPEMIPEEFLISGKEVRGGYGASRWTLGWAPNGKKEDIDWAGRDRRKNWSKQTAVRTPYNVPLMFDCLSPGATPFAKDDPPEYNGQMNHGPQGRNNNMSWVSLDRHGGGSNFVFCDGSGRKVKVKECWEFNWYKDYEHRRTAAIEFPAWMK